MRRNIDQGTLIDLIAAGFPEYIINKIDREELNDTVDLFNEIGKYEHIVNKKNFQEKKSQTSTKTQEEKKKACKVCEKLGKETRFHNEDTCWFKNTIRTQENRNFIKHVNNSVVEAELIDTDTKNE